MEKVSFILPVTKKLNYRSKLSLHLRTNFSISTCKLWEKLQRFSQSLSELWRTCTPWKVSIRPGSLRPFGSKTPNSKSNSLDSSARSLTHVMNKFPPSGPFMLLQTTQAHDCDCATCKYTTLSTQEKLKKSNSCWNVTIKIWEGTEQHFSRTRTGRKTVLWIALTGFLKFWAHDLCVTITVHYKW